MWSEKAAQRLSRFVTLFNPRKVFHTQYSAPPADFLKQTDHKDDFSHYISEEVSGERKRTAGLSAGPHLLTSFCFTVTD